MELRSKFKNMKSTLLQYLLSFTDFYDLHKFISLGDPILARASIRRLIEGYDGRKTTVLLLKKERFHFKGPFKKLAPKLNLVYEFLDDQEKRRLFSLKNSRFAQLAVGYVWSLAHMILRRFTSEINSLYFNK